MAPITARIGALFNPQKPAEMDFKAAVYAVDTQRIARIAKIALFTFTSIATMAVVLLSEAAVIAWPFTLTAIAVTLVAGALFYRLNSLDRRYVEDLDDSKRSLLAKNELERLFHTTTPMSNEQIAKSLKEINLVLESKVFNQEKIEFLQRVNDVAKFNKKAQTLAQTIVEQMVPFDFSCQSEWVKEGRFGLPAYKYNLSVTWSSTPGEIKVDYQCEERDKQPEEAPPKATLGLSPQLA